MKKRQALTVKEVAELLLVHPSTVYKLLKRGQLPGFKVGSDWRFDAETLEAWMIEKASKRQES